MFLVAFPSFGFNFSFYLCVYIIGMSSFHSVSISISISISICICIYIFCMVGLIVVSICLRVLPLIITSSSYSVVYQWKKKENPTQIRMILYMVHSIVAHPKPSIFIFHFVIMVVKHITHRWISHRLTVYCHTFPHNLCILSSIRSSFCWCHPITSALSSSFNSNSIKYVTDL